MASKERSMSPVPGRPSWTVRCALAICIGAVCGAVGRAEEPSPEPPGLRITATNATRLRELPSLDLDVRRIVWRPDGKQAAFVYWEKPVEVRDTKTFKLLHTIGAGRKLISFAFSPNRDMVAYCENSHDAEILNLRTKRTTRLPTGNHQPGPAFSPDGKLVATGGYGDAARIWDAATGKLIRSLDVGPTKGGLTVVFSPNGKVLAVGHRNSTTRLFDVATGNLLVTLPEQMTQGLSFHPDGKTLAVAYVNGSVRLWEVATGKLLRTVQTGAQEIYTLDWSRRGDVLVSAGLKSQVTLWDTKDLSVLKSFESPEWVISVRFTPDGTRLLAAGGGSAPGAQRKVRVWGVGGRAGARQP
jgi:WD40 repeat protein